MRSDEFASWRDAEVRRRAQWQFAVRGHDADSARAAAADFVDTSWTLGGSDPLANEVLVAGDSLASGWLWLRRDPRDGGVRVGDCTLPIGRLAEAVTAVTAYADRVGTRMITAVCWPGDVHGGDFVSALGAERSASQMDLAFGVDGPPVSGGVELRPMTDAQFEEYRTEAVEGYAQERADAGEPPDVATANARESYERLLPDGLDSEGQWLWTAYDGDVPVGLLWIGAHLPHAFVYDVQVSEDHRRRGLGRAIMQAGAAHCRASGRTGLGLNVFAPNTGARALYDQLGYRTVEDFYRRAL
ncbi:GNAT family N-acetyltransferase [Allobranchiibius sp. GilTou38]|uniref:GNAT family N-acetyltransferase n=1 Tax=Allobranchiibius sp. GilTou38 TaxID=2815210 RepID=UPI001AA0E283|nr:GNAT family N-acetyltransferase [Allobranchiibius sp. GilTou38]MBO1768141.1 GNAT family N-acetyltransferase [Allobranchiibius sp. GilTou38]